MIVEQPIPQRPDVGDSNLVLGVLNHAQGIVGTAKDISDNANDGTVSGGVKFKRVGAELDGTDGKIDLGDVGNIQEISGWFKFATTSEDMVLTDTGADIAAVSGTITYTTLTATATLVDGVASTTIVAGQWHFIVMQFSTEDANNFELGTDGTNFGNIEVRDLRAWTTARSASEIAAEYAAGVPDDSLAGLWLPSKGIVNDYSRYRDDMSIFGTLNATRRGMDGYTNNDYLKLVVADYRASDTQGSICAWIFLTGVGDFQHIWTTINEISSSDHFLFLRLTNGDLLTLSQKDGTTTDTVTGDTVFVTGRWYNVWATSNGSTFALYVNGVAETLTPSGGGNTGDWLSGIPTPFRDNVTIGAQLTNTDDHPVLGELSDVRYYSEGKSADFIKEYYNRTRIFY